MKLPVAVLGAVLGLAGSVAGVEMLATVDSESLCPRHPFQLLISSFKSIEDVHKPSSNGTKNTNKKAKVQSGQRVVVAEQDWKPEDFEDEDFEETSSVSNIPTFATLTANMSHLDFVGKLWEVRSSRGKGLGLFARRKIKRGTRIVVETPLFTIRPQNTAGGDAYTLQQLFNDVENAYKQLSPGEKAAYLTCFDNRPADDKETSREVLIFKNNAAPLSDGTFGIFPKMAKINHSCKPNAVSVYSEPQGTRIIWAARDIKKGEEITITYVPLLQTTEQRREGLANYGFHCECEVCRAHDVGTDHEHGDEKRANIAILMSALEEQLVNPDKVRKNVLKRAVKLVRAIEEEELADYLAKAYHLAAFAALRKEMPEKARYWGEKELEIHEFADEDSQFARATAQFLEGLMASE
jgi:hypothetical protein